MARRYGVPRPPAPAGRLRRRPSARPGWKAAQATERGLYTAQQRQSMAVTAKQAETVQSVKQRLGANSPATMYRHAVSALLSSALRRTKSGVRTAPTVEAPATGVLPETARVLYAAADILDRDGWCQGQIINDAGNVCAAGALTAAVTGHAKQNSLFASPPNFDRFMDAIVALQRHIDRSTVAWNDQPGRTAAEVVAAMRAAALIESAR